MPRAFNGSTSQVQANYSPLQSFPSSQNLPDVAASTAEFIANTTEQALLGGLGSIFGPLCGLVTGSGSGSIGSAPSTAQMMVTGQGLVGGGSQLLTGNSGSYTNATSLMGGLGDLLNSLCGLGTGTSLTGTSGSSILSGLSGGMASGSSLLTGNANSITSGMGLLSCLGGSGGLGAISGLLGPAMTSFTDVLDFFVGFLNDICSLMTGGSSSGSSLTGLLGGLSGSSGLGSVSSLLSGSSTGLTSGSGILGFLGSSMGSTSSLLTGGSGISSITGLLSCLSGSGGLGSLSSLLSGNSGTYTNASSLLGGASGLLSTGHGIVGSSLGSGMGGLLGGLTSWIGLAGGALGGTGGETQLGHLLGPFGGLLNGGSGLNSGNLFGQIGAQLLGHIPISHIAQPTTPVNLVSDPNFTQANSVGGSVFSQDLTQSYGGVAGSAKVIADGTGPKDLVSNLIQVVPGQVIDVAVVAQWTAVLSTGTPITLGLNYYTDTLGATLASQPNVASLAASPGTSTWQLLDGPSTVPAGANAVRVRLTLGPSATAGTVWFTNVNLNKSGLLPASLTQFSGGGTVDTVLSTHADSLSTLFGTTVTTGQWTDLLGIFGGASNLSGAGGFLGDLLNGGSPINGANIINGSVPTNAAPDFGILFNTVTNFVGGFGGSGFGQTDVATSFGHQAQVVTGHAASISTLASQVAALQAAATGVTLVTVTDNFVRVNNANLGTNWNEQYLHAGQGIYATPGGTSTSWAPAGSAANSVVCQWIGPNPNSATDNQEITVVLASATQAPFLGTPSFVDVLGRMSPDRLNFVRLRFQGDGVVRISRVIAGAETIIFSSTCTAPAAGASLTLIPGIPGVPRAFQGYMNGNLVISTSDITSLIGTGYRGWGHGVGAGVNTLFGLPVSQAAAPSISNWSAVG